LADRREERLRVAALDALRRYREGSASGPNVEALLRSAGEAEDAPRRREESIRWAERELGFERPFAALIYDIGREERLEPGFAYELVRCGVGVLALAEPTDGETTVEGAPDWVAQPAGRASAERERTLRASFRRLRGHLERQPSAEAALAAFVDEPDVGSIQY
jgi:hypothetical protein